jgi:hypothetical protein
MTSVAAAPAAPPVLGTGPPLRTELTVPRMSVGRRQAVLGIEATHGRETGDAQNLEGLRSTVLGTGPRLRIELAVPRTARRR